MDLSQLDHQRRAIAASSRRMRGGALRWVAPLVLCVAAVALAVLLLGSGSQEYRVVFDTAGQLVKGDIVRIGGTEVGTVKDIRLTSDSRAEIRVSVSDDYAPLHQGTTAIIRQQGLVGVASRYVDLSPGPNSSPALAAGAVIGDDEQATAIVDIDQLFNTLDPATRDGLADLIHGSASWYDGREERANRSAELFPAALTSMTRVADELTSDDKAFEQLVVETGDAMSALAERRGELTDLVGNARQTAAALGDDTEALSAVLRDTAPALREGSDAFVALRPALADLRDLVEVSGPATRDLAPFMRELRPVVQRAVPTFRDLRRMFAQPGPDDDLLDALRDLPQLADRTEQAAPRGRQALQDSTPMFAFARPYTPDLVGWLRSFGSAMATYDANGHYARTVPVFNAFDFLDDAEGGRLEPKPPDQRGSSAAVSTGNLRRCPGGGIPAPADGSAPFVDSGPDANADCDPSQRPGGGG
ncbi:MAG TPA: MlaD family protein [Solirubrobacteraceae bacterium]|nr:MlaD family protein [Solirubrobacteraceae bacterium]